MFVCVVAEVAVVEKIMCVVEDCFVEVAVVAVAVEAVVAGPIVVYVDDVVVGGRGVT